MIAPVVWPVPHSLPVPQPQVVLDTIDGCLHEGHRWDKDSGTAHVGTRERVAERASLPVSMVGDLRD